MNKTVVKAIVGIVAILLLVVSYFYYTLFLNPASPKETVAYVKENISLEVVYSRPYKKGRLIFGQDEDGALVPYGTYWRLGANAASTFETLTDIAFAGRMLPAGKYRLYAIPQAYHWTIVLNKEFSAFGYSEPDYSKDVMRVNVASAKLLTPIEQFSIDILEGNESLTLRMRWDTTAVLIPLN